MNIHRGDALDLISGWTRKLDLVVTDPPYAFGGAGPEHALGATVAVVLRETAKHLAPGAWMLVFSASSWRSIAYMVESLRGVADPVRVGTWTKPRARTRVNAAGWRWASVPVLVFRKGRGDLESSTELLDHVVAEPVTTGRRAELPSEVAAWAVQPYAKLGGVFLDPFAGSGALVTAAATAGMEAHGFEVSPPR